MFVDSFVRNDMPALGAGIAAFLEALNTTHNFSWRLDSRELPTGFPSRFLDIYPEGLVDKYESFGIIYVRLWLVSGDPQKIIAGVFLGAERSQQAEPRRAAAYVRSRLADLLDPLERNQGFQYKTWGDADIWWRQPGISVRAVTRQLEQFITYKVWEANEQAASKIEGDVTALVHFVDRAIDELQPIREFGKDILLLYFGQNLPPAPLGEEPWKRVSSKLKEVPQPYLPPQNDLEWFTALPSTPDFGNLKGLDTAYQRLVAALAAGKHALLIGPPGVGKTELAEAVCRLIPRPYEIVTATSDWTSVHTIGGYMPVPLGDTSGEPLDFMPGVFTEAMGCNKWLVIDEMNRADIDKAFGEMFTLLGGKSKSVVLPYRKRQDDGTYRRIVLGQANTDNDDQHLFRLDPSWRLIGTMNTFDKASLFQMSFAFSRRVAVIEMPVPDEITYKSILEAGAAILEKPQGEGSEIYDGVLELLSKVFAVDGGGGLSGLGLRVGPAIPLDIIKFVARMSRFEQDPTNLVLTGLEMYLFPQFEGLHEQTPEIAARLASALGMQALPDVTVARLRTFTGSVA